MTFPSIRKLNQLIASTKSRRSSVQRRKTSLQSRRRLAFVEQLEDRRLLAVGAVLTGNDIVFSGDATNDLISFSVNTAGQLQHSRGGSFGFASNLDLDSGTAGEQSQLVSEITSFRYDDAGGNDRLFFGGANPFSFGDAGLYALAGQITVNANTVINSTGGFIEMIAQQKMLLDAGSSLTTVDGGISLKGNPNGNSIGELVGLETLGTSIRTSGQGNIELSGFGGNDSSEYQNHGILLGPGTSIESTKQSSPAGTISINGTGGDSRGSSHGVSINGADVVLRSAYGDIEIVGQGGLFSSGNGSSFYGVDIKSADLIESTGIGADAATITIDGTGGAGSRTNYGVQLLGATTDITSVDGNIRIVGQGGGDGSSDSNYGVYSTGLGSIRSSGTSVDAATIAIIGDGGNGTRSSSGILLSGVATELTSAYGDISFVGRGGAGGGYSNQGGFVGFAISSTGSGEMAAKIDITGTGGINSSGAGVSVSGSVTSIDGDINIAGTGTGDGTRTYDYGAAVVNATVTSHGLANVTVVGTGGQGAGANYGVQISDASFTTHERGAIAITGQGGNGGAGNTGVYITNLGVIESKGLSDGVTPSSATITIAGTGGSGTGSNNGVNSSGTSEGITSVDGAISIIGQGGAGTLGSSNGVSLTSLGAIRSTGTSQQAATITVHGSGGTSKSGSYGVAIGATSFNSFVGDISITGTGGTGDLELSTSTTLGVSLTNVDIASLGTLENATGSPATITIDGTGGVASRQNYGTNLEQSAVSSVVGNINIRGEGGTASAGDIGVRVRTTELTSTGEGSQAANILFSSNGGVDAAGVSLSTIDGNVSFLGLNGSFNYASGTMTSNGLGKLTFDGGDVRVGGDISSGFGDIVVSGSSIFQTSGLIESTGTGSGAAKILIGDESTHSIRLGGDLSSFDGDIEIANHITDASTGAGYVWIYGNITSTGTDKVDAAKLTINGTGADGQTGVYFGGSNQIISSVVGDISITGTGGNSTSVGVRGISLERGASLASTGTGNDAAKITVMGTGGAGVSSNFGVYLSDDNSSITSFRGDISVTGVGGAGTGGSNTGVYLLKGSISSTGEVTTTEDGEILKAATIAISGTGGAGTGSGLGVETRIAIDSRDGAIEIFGDGGANGTGVYLNFGSSITSSGEGASAATITVDGTAGTGTYGSGVQMNQNTLTSKDGDVSITGRGREGRTTGIYIDGAVVSSTGTGADAAAVSILGNGGDGTQNNNGIEVRRATTSFTTVDGDLSIVGRGGAGSGPIGIIFSEFATIASTGTGPNAGKISITGALPEGSNGHAMNFSSAASPNLITSVDGDIAMSVETNSSGSTGLYAYYGAFHAESTGVGANAANILIQSSGTEGGGMGLSAASRIVTVDGNIALIGTRGMYIDAPVESTGTGAFAGEISIADSSAIRVTGDVTSIDGNISIVGAAFDLTGRIISTGVGPSAATITVEGITDALNTNGVELHGEVTSTDGDILISGTGNSRYRNGVEVAYGGFVRSLGSDKDLAATITINGNGGLAGGTGVSLIGGTAESPNLSTLVGDVHIIGQGGNGPENANRGVRIYDGYIQSLGETSASAGNIKIEGVGGIGGTYDLIGVEIDYNTSQLVSIAGNIEIIATAGIGSGANNVGLLLNRDSVVGDVNTTGDITIRTDSIDLRSGAIQSTGALTIEPKLTGTSIGIGGGAGDLNLGDAELALLVDGFESITIGNAVAGIVDIDTATFTDNVIIAGEKINDHAGTDIDAGANTVSLIGTISPGQSPGILSLAGAIGLADNSVLELDVNGSNAGESATDHDQVSVVGTLTIGTGVELRTMTTNGFDPTLGQQLVIVENDGSDPIVGVFDGLPEGTILTDFLGAPLDARISYLGLDETTGNDVVLTIILGNLAPIADAGGPYSIEEGESLSLDASGSSDPDDDTLSYEWDLNGDGDFSDAIGVAPMLTWDDLVALGMGDIAEFEVTVSVDDGRANAVTDSAIVNVLLNSPPTADAGGPYFVDEGGSVTLDARGSTDDKGIENLNITWDLDGDGNFEETGLQPLFSAPLVDGPNVLTVQVRVEDDRGRVDIDSTTVSVRNVAPTLHLDAPITVVRGDVWTLEGTFVDPGPDSWTVTVNYADDTVNQLLVPDPVTKTFQLEHVYNTAGAYTAIVTIDDGDGGVTSKNLSIVVQLPSLPDLTLISANVSFEPINPGVGVPIDFVVDVTNKGTLAASNVPVIVQVYDAATENFVEIGRGVIPSIDAKPISPVNAKSEAQISLTWDGRIGQPALPSEDAYLLVRVLVDPDLTIEELDESNNEAIQVLQVGSPDFGTATLVADLPDFTANRGVRVPVGGRAYYHFLTGPGSLDFPVQNASVTARLIDQTGQVLAVSGGRTAPNGNFLHFIRAPEEDGDYTLKFEVSDGTLSSVFESQLVVSGEAPEVPPRPRGPAGPGYVFSSSIEFVDAAGTSIPPLPPGNPQIGEPITILGSFLYELDLALLDVPVTFNDLFPVAGQVRTFEIGSGSVSFPDGGLDEPTELGMDWTPTAEGYHIIQAIAAPDFKFNAHTNTTRLLLVGDLDTTSLSVVYEAENVPDPAPAFAPLMSASRGFAAAGLFSAPMAMTPSGAPEPGDTLSFTLRYENTGTTTITGGMLIDDFDETLMGTPTHISHGGITDGNIVRWELGDIAPGTSGTVSYQVTINSAAEFPPGSAYLFNTAILNADQAVAAGTNELILSNKAPVITGLNVDEMLDENGDVILSGTFSDASIAETHTVQIEWGDGQSDTLTFIAGERSFSIPHAYGVDHAPLAASYIVHLSVTDGTNQQDADSVTTEVPENQLAPLALADSYDVDQATTLSVGIADSVLTNDTAASSEPLKSLLVTAPEHASSFTLNDDGTFTYTPQADFRGIDQFVYVAQSSGRPSEATIVEIDVRNLAPTISSAVIVGADEQAVAGEVLALNGSFLDAGTVLAHSGTVDWGDGSGPQALSVAFELGSGSFEATHVYANPGTYTTTITISDGDLETTALVETTVIEEVVTEPGVRVANGKLQIIGTDDNDFVSVSRRGTQVYVEASFLSTPRRWGFGSVSFPLSDVQSIHAEMGAGNDIFHVSAFLDLPTIIDGGEGDDILSAGGGPSLIFGGAGNDLLVGGRDRSVLVGGSGRDRLLGVIRSGAQAETRR